MEDHREFYYDNDEYFNPKLNLNDSVLKEKVLNLIDVFRIPKSKIDSLQKRIINAIDSVLSNKDSSKNSEFLPLFNTLVTKYPNNQESGVFLGLDIGGTNLRIVLLNLKDSDESDRKIIIDNYDVPVEFRQSTSEKFFDYLAGCLKNFYDKNQNILKDSPSRIPLGFSFSFCFEQLTINSGRCLQFGIATNLIDGIGKCPVQLFQKSIDSLQLPVEIVALANDSTTTLICGKYFDPKTEISLILGSGGNVAYVENVAADFRIENPREKFGLPLAPEKMIINSEVFLFGDNHQIDDLKTCYDFELDAMSLLPGNYTKNDWWSISWRTISYGYFRSRS
ncbi:hypothetical protein SSS_09794 [Sarcoptes scabiei]|nr:hypothetical protein SSS_09794 [Sarcoptes scabiei]